MGCRQPVGGATLAAAHAARSLPSLAIVQAASTRHRPRPHGRLQLRPAQPQFCAAWRRATPGCLHALRKRGASRPGRLARGQVVTPASPAAPLPRAAGAPSSLCAVLFSSCSGLGFLGGLLRRDARQAEGAKVEAQTRVPRHTRRLARHQLPRWQSSRRSQVQVSSQKERVGPARPSCCGSRAVHGPSYHAGR